MTPPQWGCRSGSTKVGVADPSLFGTVDPASPVGVVNLAPPVVDLVPPGGVVDLAPQAALVDPAPTSWCGGSAPTSRCGGSAPHQLMTQNNYLLTSIPGADSREPKDLTPKIDPSRQWTPPSGAALIRPWFLFSCLYFSHHCKTTIYTPLPKITLENSHKFASTFGRHARHAVSTVGT